jgi:hemerythrin-like metal-binding protein
MGIVWTANLATGINEIDSQHKELFTKINNLIDAMSKGEGKKVIEDVFKFLTEYCKVHFYTEEGLMTSKSYPDFASHKQLHNGFMTKLAELKKRVDTEGVNSTIVIEAQPLLVDWWYNHINKIDKVLGEFLKKH